LDLSSAIVPNEGNAVSLEGNPGLEATLFIEKPQRQPIPAGVQGCKRLALLIQKPQDGAFLADLQTRSRLACFVPQNEGPGFICPAPDSLGRTKQPDAAHRQQDNQDSPQPAIAMFQLVQTFVQLVQGAS
jgi:hypothetical protein